MTLPLALKVLLGQATQLAGLGAPSSGLYVPPLHLSQKEQVRFVVSQDDKEEVRGTRRQPAAWLKSRDSDANLVQGSGPIVSEYVPGRQIEQVPPDGPVKPSTQSHCVSRVEPALLVALSGHLSHADTLLVARPVEYVPAEH